MKKVLFECYDTGVIVERAWDYAPQFATVKNTIYCIEKNSPAFWSSLFARTVYPTLPHRRRGIAVPVGWGWIPMIHPKTTSATRSVNCYNARAVTMLRRTN